MTAFASVALSQLFTFAIAGDIPQQVLRKKRGMLMEYGFLLERIKTKLILSNGLYR